MEGPRNGSDMITESGVIKGLLTTLAAVAAWIWAVLWADVAKLKREHDEQLKEIARLREQLGAEYIKRVEAVDRFTTIEALIREQSYRTDGKMDKIVDSIQAILHKLSDK